ncbi:TetR/AcrR family transcriptional regulator [Brevibacillus sp. SYSU BS000544]|uniref:TetR/AcrR family transcriptional regulator n=1 Tax=Brevibacillus sp. SYSU BS000544 TaxID=3416443 RepID=UPI003CE59598
MSDQSFEESLQRFLEELKDEDDMTEKQRNILSASIKLFASKGFHATSTSEIAKEAGVAEGTIFRHYKSKKDILIATVAPLIIKFAAPFVLKDVRRIFEFAEEQHFEEVVKALYRNRLELVEHSVNHARILLQEAFFHDEIREAIIQTFFKQAQQIIGKVIERKIELGELRPLPVDVIFRVIFSQMIGIVIHRYIIAPEQFDDEGREKHIELTADILMNGLRPR